MSEAVDELFLFGEEKMEKAISQLRREFGMIRTGRANPGILDKVVVDYYGAPTALRQMSQVSVSEGTTLMITPYDKTILKDIEKAQENYKKALNLNYKNAVAHMSIGNAHYLQGDIENALVSYRDAIKMAPDNDEYKLVYIQILDEYIDKKEK